MGQENDKDPEETVSLSEEDCALIAEMAARKIEDTLKPKLDQWGQELAGRGNATDSGTAFANSVANINKQFDQMGYYLTFILASSCSSPDDIKKLLEAEKDLPESDKEALREIQGILEKAGEERSPDSYGPFTHEEIAEAMRAYKQRHTGTSDPEANNALDDGPGGMD